MTKRDCSREPLGLGFAGGGTDVLPVCDLEGGFVPNATTDMYALRSCIRELIRGCRMLRNG